MVNVGTPSDGSMAPRLPTIDADSSLAGGCGGVSRQSATERRKALRKRLPPWFKTSLPTGDAQTRYNETRSSVHEHGLHTVCEEARCPNVHDCWGRGTATFMIAGEVCTRGCRFCAVGTEKTPSPLDVSEPSELAEAVKRMGLDHAVIIVRDRRASFEQSLSVLREARRLRPDILIKSSIMVGLGETDEEVSEAMRLLFDAGVEMLTLGQYLQPSDRHLPVDRFPEPEQFANWDSEAREIGFRAVASGPLVRSSYRAGLLWDEARGGAPVLLGGQVQN